MQKTLFATVSLAALMTAGVVSAQVVSPEDVARKQADPSVSPCSKTEIRVGQRCVDAAAAAKAGIKETQRSNANTNGGARPGRAAAGFMGATKRMVYAAVPGSIVTFNVVNRRGEPSSTYVFDSRINFEPVAASLQKESISAMMANPVTNMAYVSTRGTLVALDLATDKVVWAKRYDEGQCCERGAVMADGVTMVVGSNVRNFHYIIDGKTGAQKGRIEMPLSPGIHNMVLSPDRKTDFGAPNGYNMSVANLDTLKVEKIITFSDQIRVFTINSDATRIYANLNNLMGFEIADVKSGKVIKRIEVPGEMWKAKWADPNLQFYGHGAPHHGIAILPDESEIWITDAINDMVHVYDNTGEWPVLNQSKGFKTNGRENGWIVYDLDGKKAIMASGDIVDVKTHKVVQVINDEYGRFMNSEKVLELLFDAEGKLQKTTDQFAKGDAAAVKARKAAAGNKSAGE